MQIAAGALIPVFCEAAPSQCETYRKNGARWQKDLEQLTEELSKQLTELTAVPFLIYHPFLDYFVARFQLRQVGKVEPESGHEPGPRHLREVLTSARKNGASVVVTSPQLSTRAVKVVTDAAQLKVVMMDDIGGSADRKTYQNLMRFNTQALVKGLKVKAK